MCCGDIGILKLVPPRSQAAVGGRREERLGGGRRGKTREESHGPSEEVRLGRQAQVGLVESVVPWGGGVCKKNARCSRTLHDCLSQDAAVQPGAGETGLLRAGGQELSVSGGVPQGLHGDRSQTSLAQRMDADQVPSFSSSSLFVPDKNLFFLSSYIHIYLSVQQDFIQREHCRSWTPHRLHVSYVFLVVFFDYFFLR